MASWGNCDFRELEKLRDRLERSAKEKDINAFCEECAKELAARLLRKVIKRTPVDTGNLRRNWTTQASGSGSEGLKTKGAGQYVDTLKVHRYGDTYVIEITNPTEYASYVEYGHRTVNGKGWVDGRFMLAISEKELQNVAPKIIEKKLYAYLKDVFE